MERARHPRDGRPLPTPLLLARFAAVLLLGANNGKRAERVIPPLADVAEDVATDGRVVVKDGARIRGSLVAPEVVLGNRVHVEGDLRADRLTAGRGVIARGRVKIAGRAVFAGGLDLAPMERPSAPVLLDGVHMDVPTRHADALIAAFAAVGWAARDTGRTVETDDEEELTTLVVDVRAGVAGSSAPAVLAQPPPAPPHQDPFVRGAVLALGDLVVGEGFEGSVDLAATGNVTVGVGAMLSGRVRAKGDLRLLDGAVVGDAACGGALHLAPDARVTGTVEAEGGLAPGTRAPERRR